MEETNLPSNSNSYRRWLIIGVVGIALGLFVLFIGSRPPTLQLASSSAKSVARLTIDSGAGNIRIFEGSTTQRMTILEALFASTQDTDIKIDYAVSPNGDVKISAIGGQVNNLGDKQWHFYLNDGPVETKDIDRTFVRAEDAILAEFR